MTKDKTKWMLHLVSLGGFLACAIVAIWGYRAGIFSSQEALQSYIDARGIWGDILFILFQMVQVVIPILPGGISCLVGVILFGPVRGFLWNYAGICIGSMMAFGIAKYCGRPLLPKLFSQKLIEKYNGWTNENSQFSKWFAIAIFLPVAPDDFLCYLAGTTEMTWRRFTAIIWAGKPFAIAAYSFGLNWIWSHIMALLG